MQPTPEPATDQSHVSTPYDLRRTPSRLQRSSWISTTQTTVPTITTSNTMDHQITGTHSSQSPSSCATSESVAMEIDTATTSSTSVAGVMKMATADRNGEVDAKEATIDTLFKSIGDYDQMQVCDDEVEKKTTTPWTMTPTKDLREEDRHRITHRLDQTTLRLCASFLIPWRIIRFGRTCHTIYSTLNHPLTWTYALEMKVELSRQPSSTSLTPFLQHCPCLWRIRSADITSSQLADAVSRLPQRSYRLVGLSIDATNDDAKNAATSELVQSLLSDVRMTNHLSVIGINPSNSVSPEGDPYFIPRALLSSILQLQLRICWIAMESFTNEMVRELSQSQLQLLELASMRKSNSSILPILAAPSSGLIHSLTELALPLMSYDQPSFTADFSALVNLKLRTLTIDASTELNKLLVPLSRIESLRHLKLFADPRWHPNPSTLVDLIRAINTTVAQIDTLTIDIETLDPITNLFDPASSDHPLMDCIREYKRQCLAVGGLLRRSGPLIVRLA